MDKHSPAVNYTDSNVVKMDRQFFGESEAKPQPIEFDKILKLANKYKYLLILCLLLGGLTGYLKAINEVPLYRTSANIIVQPESSNRSEYLSSSLRLYVPSSFYETEMVVLKSNLVLEKAARYLSPIMIGKLFAKQDVNWFGKYVESLKVRIKSWVELIGINTPYSKPETVNVQSNSQVANIPISVIARKIRNISSATFGVTDQLITLSVSSNDPLVAAVVANAVVDAYINHLVENRVSQTERAGQWLAERVAESRNKLTEAENSLREFQYKEQLFDLSTVKSLSSATLGNVNTALLVAEQNFTELSKRYGPKHPALIEAKKKLISARNQYGDVSEKDLGDNEIRFELTKLERAVNSNRELYELFLSRFNEVELGIDSVSSNTRILERAVIPGSPYTPNVKRSLFTGTFAGLFFGFLLLFAREFFDRTFKHQYEAEERLQLPVLGVLPLLTEGKFRRKKNELPERYYSENSKSNFSEVVNHIRTGVIYSNVDRQPKVILVTSALPQEGKTTCANNLGLAFSKIGKTLLMDADFRKPRIAKISNVDNVQGLTGYVVGQNTLQDCLSQDSEFDDLFIMKSGEVPPNPLELLSSVKFRDTLELMKKNFDYIIIDSAPIIPVSDGIVLGKLSDAIIMVLKAGSTTHHTAETAIKRFRAANLNPVGLVLSQLDYKTSHYYYGKYQYYAKEYYG